MGTSAANFLSSNHWVHFVDPERRQVYVFSGTCILDPPLVGPQDGSRWQRGSGWFEIPVPDLPTDQGLVVEQWAPTVLLGSIQNDNVANNAGWAIDDFDLEGTDTPSESVTPTFNYAVGDTDGYIMRVAYSVTVVGYFAPLPIIQ
jgi:hypothetical protein